MIGAWMLHAQSQKAARFEVVSIKPTSQAASDISGLGDVDLLPGGLLRAEKVQLRYFIQDTYNVKPFQLLGGPAWIQSAHYDIEAKAAEGDPDHRQMRVMMQALLADRFRLRAHHETRQLPVYRLKAAKGGIKLRAPKAGGCNSDLPCERVVMMMFAANAQMHGQKVPMGELVRVLSNVMGRTVVDQTGFTGMFDFDMEFTPDQALAGVPTPPPMIGVEPKTGEGRGGTIFAAMQEQLGLKLEAGKGPVDVVVIESVERPTGN
jgi:uncharacterized protein (TIGR03435 family)